MTSKLTRERLVKIKSWREIYGAGSNVMLPAEEAEALALIALAAMDSEPVAWTWQHLKQWYVTNDEERARELAWDGVKVEQLYRHAQPVPVVSADLLHTAASAIEDLLTTKDRTGACVWFDLPFRLRSAANAHSAPVVPDDVLAALQKVARIRLDLNDFDGDRRGIADCLGDAEEALIEVVNRRAAMLQAEPVCTCPSGNGSLRWPCPVHAGSSPVIPDGYVLVPMRLTAENGAKGALSGEFSETKFLNCPECFGDDECETCDGSGKIEITVPVTWTTIKAIWVKGVEHFSVTAQEND
ncbi:Uncharacterised protein [Klebsiella pneumoniae]|nr:hypothetical protein [Klebsiella pneumoniae]VVK75587.1 Uncharacterised protein [Klebsiella pneumoniae]